MIKGEPILNGYVSCSSCKCVLVTYVGYTVMDEDLLAGARRALEEHKCPEEEDR